MPVLTGAWQFLHIYLCVFAIAREDEGYLNKLTVDRLLSADLLIPAGFVSRGWRE